jgi:hypothetical protein
MRSMQTSPPKAPMSERAADLSQPSWCFSSDGIFAQAQEHVCSQIRHVGVFRRIPWGLLYPNMPELEWLQSEFDAISPTSDPRYNLRNHKTTREADHGKS